MKRCLFALLIVFLTIYLFSETKDEDYKLQNFDLKWKVNKDEMILYKTNMDNIDSKNNDITSDDNKSSFDQLAATLKDLRKEIEDYTMITVLKKDINQNIDITMVSENFTGNNKSNNDGKFKNIFKGIRFRGVINKDGYIESFYLKQSQKNLLAVFFQLPEKPVKINDEWKLDINWIELDQSFICKNKEKINKVKLIDIKKNINEMIAILQYKIYEKVEGVISFPNNENKDIKMEMDFDGISEFSITNGKWAKYSGVSSYTISGYQNNNVKQKFLLQEIDKMPKEIEKYFK